MKKKVSILQIGLQNWQEQFEINPEIDWEFCKPNELDKTFNDRIEKSNLAIKAAKKAKKFPPRKFSGFDAVILQDVTGIKDLMYLEKYADYYTLIYDPKLTGGLNNEIESFLKKRLAWPKDLSNPQLAVDLVRRGFFPKQSGASFEPTKATFTTDNVKYEGTRYAEVVVDSPDEFTTIAVWNSSIYSDPGKTIELWLEYIKDESLEVRMVARASGMGSIDYNKNIHIFTEEQMQVPVLLEKFGDNTFSNVGIEVKGKGKIKVGHLHFRWSRFGFGNMIIGGQRYATKKREEFFYYFNPGDMKPPLNIYFSGYRSLEGFEGFFMMKKMGTPFMLIADPRFEGGGFYLGDEEYESKLLEVINNAKDYLGFTNKQINMAGFSMGTFGSLYYSSKILPHAVLGVKPIVNLGNIARNGHIDRPNNFNTIFDVVKLNEGGLSEKSLEHINQHFWNAFKAADYSDTKFIFGHMFEDDYDNETYNQMLEVLNQKGALIIGKGAHGLHTDGSQELIPWFLKQFNYINENDFNRGDKDE